MGKKKEKDEVMDLRTLTDMEVINLLRDGFVSEFWNILSKILFSWRNTIAHRIALQSDMNIQKIAYQQGYYRALDDFIKLKNNLKKAARKGGDEI